MSNETMRSGKYDDFLSAEWDEAMQMSEGKVAPAVRYLAKRLQEAHKLNFLQADAVLLNYTGRLHPELPPRCGASRKAAPLLGQFDEFIAGAVESQRQAGKTPAMILVIRDLTKEKGLGVRDARSVYEEYCARQAPELLYGSAGGGSKWLGWFLLPFAAYMTVLAARDSSPSALSVAPAAIYWVLACNFLADAYWAKGEPGKSRIVNGITGLVFTALGVANFCILDGSDRWTGLITLPVALAYFAAAGFGWSTTKGRRT